MSSRGRTRLRVRDAARAARSAGLLALAAARLAAAQGPAPADAGALVARAARAAAAQGPAAFAAHVESEFGQVAVAVDGTESVVAAEQVASWYRWTPGAGGDQRVTGYRARAVGFGFSALALFDRGWVLPTLAGDRIPVFFGRDTARLEDRVARRTLALASLVGPLARDRDAFYTYAPGGERRVALGDAARETRVVRVLVAPRPGLRGSALVLRGELLLDAATGHLAAVRGEVLDARGRSAVGSALDRVFYHPVAFVDLRLAPADGTGGAWLPAYQRVELVTGLPAAEDARGAFRVVSHFTRVAPAAAGATLGDALGNALGDVSRDVSGDAPGGPARPPEGRLTVAPPGVLARHRAWRHPAGVRTGRAAAADLADVAPDRLRALGAPRLDAQAERARDLLRFNRVEGLYVGLGAAYRYRTLAPGWTARADLGYAAEERTARGQMAVEHARDGWRAGLRAARRLETTNDFVLPLDSASTLAALLLTTDDQDYVDRRAATLWAERRVTTRRPGTPHAAPLRLRVEGGVANDRYTPARASRGLFEADSAFRPNRAVQAGSYVRSAAELSWNAAARTSLADPGWGGALRYERGDGLSGEPRRSDGRPRGRAGRLTYERVEARAFGVAGWRRWTVAARADAGVLVGPARPPQQLFELGGTPRLAGYDYKAFTGDRGAALVASVLYSVPVLHAPFALGVPRWRRVLLPSLAPALAVRLETGWVEASPRLRALARADAAAADGADAPPTVVRATDGTPSSVEAGVVLFGGALSAGAARPLAPGGTWRSVVRLGRVF